MAAVAAAVLAGSLGQAAQSNLAAVLRVTVDGLRPSGGTLRLALHDEATFSSPNARALRYQDVPAAAGDLAVQLERLPPGVYALLAFQDLNNNGVRDPGEPLGVSNDGGMDFDKAAIVLMPGNNTATIHLR